MARRKARMTLREIGVIAFLCLAVFWLSLLVWSIFQKQQVARMTVERTRAELAALEARKETLSATVGSFNSERGREASLRTTYGVAKPGEDVIIVVPKKELPPPPVQTFWEKVKGFFGK